MVHAEARRRGERRFSRRGAEAQRGEGVGARSGLTMGVGCDVGGSRVGEPRASAGSAAMREALDWAAFPA